jgi:hypothetical protein
MKQILLFCFLTFFSLFLFSEGPEHSDLPDFKNLSDSTSYSIGEAEVPPADIVYGDTEKKYLAWGKQIVFDKENNSEKDYHCLA